MFAVSFLQVSSLKLFLIKCWGIIHMYYLKNKIFKNLNGVFYLGPERTHTAINLYAYPSRGQLPPCSCLSAPLP